MKKHIFYIVFLSFLAYATNAHSQSVLTRATGYGVDYESAKMAAFREAIQSVYGLVVASEVKINNNDISEEDFSYSKGIIESYSIISQYKNLSDGQYVVTLRALVSESNVARRYIVNSGNKEIDGQAAQNAYRNSYANVATTLDRFNRSYRLTQHLAKDFWHSFFDIKTNNVEFLSSNGAVSTRIHVSLSVNKNFHEGFCSAASELNKSFVAASQPADSTRGDFFSCHNRSIFNSVFFGTPAYRLPREILNFVSGGTSSLFNGSYRQVSRGDRGFCIRFIDDRGVKVSSVFILFDSSILFPNQVVLEGRGISTRILHLVNADIVNQNVITLDQKTSRIFGENNIRTVDVRIDKAEDCS